MEQLTEIQDVIFHHLLFVCLFVFASVVVVVVVVLPVCLDLKGSAEYQYSVYQQRQSIPCWFQLERTEGWVPTR